MEFNFEKGTFLRISFEGGRDVLSIFKDINEDNEIITYADYFLESRSLFYDFEFNTLCNIRFIKNVRCCLDIEITSLINKLLERRIIFKDNKLYKLKHEDYTVVRLGDLIAIYGGENGYYHCINLETNEERFGLPFDFIQTFKPVTKEELLSILPALESFPFVSYKVRTKYDLFKKEKHHIGLDPKFLKILKNNLDNQLIAVHKNLYDEGNLIANVEDIPVVIPPAEMDLEYVHRIADRFFKDDKLNYPPRHIRNYCIGDVIYVRNIETEEWVKKFFACFDKMSDGKTITKTTDGKSWKLYKS